MNRRHNRSETDTLLEEKAPGLLEKTFFGIFLEEKLIPLVLAYWDRPQDIHYQLVEERLESFSRYNHLNAPLRLTDLSRYLMELMEDPGSIEGVSIELAARAQTMVHRIVGEKAHQYRLGREKWGVSR